ncbi:MAG: hypothetical protein ACMVP2_10610 [Imperialibacter sp.]|uniref:hypothetical protein n=1 Tax=Imperialibacter sp. TaxID=2038411 RepID=UPI003A847F3A
MRGSKLLVTGLFFSPFFVEAMQQPLPLFDQITVGIENRPEIKAAKQQVEWFQQNRYGVAYFDEIDFRVGGITNDKTEYAFRLRPTNPFYYAAGKSMGKLLESEAQLKLREAMQTALFDKIETWLKIRYVALQLQETEASVAWRQKWLENMAQYISEGEFDAEELLDVELERIDLAVDRMDLSEELENELADFLEEPVRTNVETLAQSLVESVFPDVALEKLLSTVDELMQVPSAVSLATEKEQLNVQLTESKVLLEKRDWDIGFVQPEWEMEGKERFGLRVGIGIPIFNTNRMQTQNRQLSLINDKWAEVKARTEWDVKLSAAYEKTLRIAERLKAMQELDVQLDTYRQKLSAIDPGDARESLLKWLKAKEKLRGRVIKDQFLLLSAYLDYLKLKGLLAEPTALSYFEDIW